MSEKSSQRYLFQRISSMQEENDKDVHKKYIALFSNVQKPAHFCYHQVHCINFVIL